MRKYASDTERLIDGKGHYVHSLRIPLAISDLVASGDYVTHGTKDASLSVHLAYEAQKACRTMFY